ncbi:SAM-dependent chlorinase/fluorinase [Amycolatopsis minnesotensis]|uniref:SAM-dependent chlorinase/fluorinase n=1 Tax=Amycolatopsis minnesotensis TaxID=337894 RepID=A0ABN2SDZ9_9PSEU
MGSAWISFTTDYGLDDGFVAACHGVIARIAPRVRVIDVTHAVPAQRIRHGASVLAQTVPYLPEAVHVAVVDPGVGTARRGVVVVAERGLLAGPDNGLLVPAAEALGGVVAAYELVAPEYRLPAVSATFHGRDVFAPAAAHLSLGVTPPEFGPPVTELVRLPEPVVRVRPGELVSEVLVIDRFGNVQLAATSADLHAAGIGDRAAVEGMDVPLGRTFGDVRAGEALLYTDSGGRLAVAVNGGSAAAALALSEDQEVTITSSPFAS